MKEFFAKQQYLEKQRQAFGDAGALYHYCFESDNGEVAQIEKARQYVQHWESMLQENLGLLFWGRPGNGKTFAAACIANALLERCEPGAPSVKMTTFGTVLNRLPGMSAQEKDWYLGSFRTCDLLILDDFGMERQTEYAREQVFNLIDGRYLARRPLIVTTNLSLKEMKNPADLGQQRIYDRILELCIPVCFDGDSLRKGKAKENLQRFRMLTSQPVNQTTW